MSEADLVTALHAKLDRDVAAGRFAGAVLLVEKWQGAVQRRLGPRRSRQTAGTGDFFGPEFNAHRLELKTSMGDQCCLAVSVFGRLGLRLRSVLRDNGPGSLRTYSRLLNNCTE